MRAGPGAAKQGLPIGLSGILRTAIGMVDAAGRRFAGLDRSLERGERQADVDRAADRVFDRVARPGAENDRDVCEAYDDGDKRYIRDPRAGSVR